MLNFLGGVAPPGLRGYGRLGQTRPQMPAVPMPQMPGLARTQVGTQPMVPRPDIDGGGMMPGPAPAPVVNPGQPIPVMPAPGGGGAHAGGGMPPGMSFLPEFPPGGYGTPPGMRRYGGNRQHGGAPPVQQNVQPNWGPSFYAGGGFGPGSSDYQITKDIANGGFGIRQREMDRFKQNNVRPVMGGGRPMGMSMNSNPWNR